MCYFCQFWRMTIIFCVKRCKNLQSSERTHLKIIFLMFQCSRVKIMVPLLCSYFFNARLPTIFVLIRFGCYYLFFFVLNNILYYSFFSANRPCRCANRIRSLARTHSITWPKMAPTSHISIPRQGKRDGSCICG